MSVWIQLHKIAECKQTKTKSLLMLAHKRICRVLVEHVYLAYGYNGEKAAMDIIQRLADVLDYEGPETFIAVRTSTCM